MNNGRSQNASRSPRRRLGAPEIITLCLLLSFPSYALSRLAPYIDWRLLVVGPLALSALAFFIYRSDKRSAEAGAWRVSESTLHLIGFIGGWPGAFLAQRIYRHKTSKLSFQLVFWSVVLLHQFAAVDSLLDWRCTKAVVRAIKTQRA